MKVRLATFLILAGLGLASGGADETDDGLPRPVLGADLVKRLLDPETRADAFYEFLLAHDEADTDYDWEWKTYPRELVERAHSNLDLVLCPTEPGEPPLYLLTYSTDHDLLWASKNPTTVEAVPEAYPEAAEEARRRLAWAATEKKATPSKPSAWKPGDPLWNDDRVLVFLDAEGRIDWPFGGNNAISRGVIGDLNGDGRFERIDFNNWGVERGTEVQTLEVSTVEEKPRTLLEVLFNWHPDEADEANRWGFDVTDRDGDGVAEIELGPANEDYSLSGPAEVVFRWDPKTGRFEGPAGGPGKHWQRFVGEESMSLWTTLKASSGLGYPIRRADAFEPGIGPPRHLPWPEREPYRHQSLAGLPDEELFRFMWSGRPHPGEERVGFDGSDWQWAEVPGGLAGMAPREAALALAEGNRTVEHRRLYELVTETGPGEAPPESGQVVMRSLGGGWTSDVYLDSVRYTPDSGEWLRCYHVPPPQYPAWRGPQEWYRVDIGAKARWVGATIWWLDRIRTVSRMDHPAADNRYQGGDDIPVYEVLYRDGSDETGKPMARAFPRTQGFGTRKFWLGHYDRSIAASLSLALWRDLFALDRQDSRAPMESRDREVVQRILTDPEPLDTWPIPDVLRLAVDTAGDRGWKAFSGDIDRLRARIGDRPDAFETEYRLWSGRREAAWKALSSGGGNAYEKRREAEAALAPMESQALTHSGVQLRDSLALARRQLDLRDDREALVKWSADSKAPGAGWALKQTDLFGEDNASAEQVLADQLSTAKADDTRWVFGELIERNLAKAIETWLGLPEEDRRTLLLSLYRGLDEETKRQPEWIGALIDLARQPIGNEYAAAEAIRILVPDEEPTRFENPAIDEAIVTAVEAMLVPGKPDYSQEQLRLAACRALALRDREAKHWNRLLDAHESALNEFGDGDIYLRSALVAQVARHPELAQEFWMRLRLKDAHGRWDDFFFDAYAADLRLAREDLAKAATRSPDEPEGPRARSWVSTPETLSGGFHSARQMIALWDEPDPVTRAKMQIVFGLRALAEEGHGKLYGASDRAHDELAAALPALDPAGAAELKRWVAWCARTAPEAVIGEALSRSQEEWLGDLAGQLID